MKISKAKISKYSALKLKKNRDKEGMFLLEGDKSVRDSASLFSVVAIVATPEWFQSFSGDINADVYEASAAELKKISSLSTAPEVIAVCRVPDYSDCAPDFLTELILVLDGIQDPGNLGTIIRTADWFGIKHIYASKTTADLFSAKTVQSTMGALARVKFHYSDLELLLRDHPDVPACGLLLDGESIYSADLPSNGFIIMGNEGNGISKPLRELITKSILIPSFPENAPTVESLNVAIATGITLSEFRRRHP